MVLQLRQNCENGAYCPGKKPEDDEPAMLSKNESAYLPVLESHCFQQAEFAAPLEDIAGDDDRQPGRAQQQAKAAEGLED